MAAIDDDRDGSPAAVDAKASSTADTPKGTATPNAESSPAPPDPPSPEPVGDSEAHPSHEAHPSQSPEPKHTDDATESQAGDADIEPADKPIDEGPESQEDPVKDDSPTVAVDADEDEAHTVKPHEHEHEEEKDEGLTTNDVNLEQNNEPASDMGLGKDIQIVDEDDDDPLGLNGLDEHEDEKDGGLWPKDDNFAQNNEPTPDTVLGKDIQLVDQNDDDSLGDPLGTNELGDSLFVPQDEEVHQDGGDFDMEFLSQAYNNAKDSTSIHDADAVIPQTNADADIDMTDIGQQAEDQDEAAVDNEYQKRSQEYSRKKKRGHNTTADDIEHMKREREHKKRKLLQHNDAEDSDGGEDDEPDGDILNPFVVSEDEGPFLREESPDEGTQAPRPPPKQRKPPAKTTKKKGGRGRGKKAEARQPAKGKRQSKKTQQQQNNLMSGFRATNVFAAAQSNPGRAEQPKLGSSTRKDQAMKELIASIPEESRDTAKTDKGQLERASKSFGRGMCRPHEGEWLINGMNSNLSHYQMLGSAFMRDRESLEDVKNPAGGLQCDAMGLGKTVMSIAVIASDRYTYAKTAKNSRSNGQQPQPPIMPTLIVAPASILHQWRAECKKHAEIQNLGGVMIFSAASNCGDEDFLTQQGVVLTTYQQVMKSYPKREYPVELVTAEAKDRWWKAYFAENKGVLHSVKWRRVILDEATCIKNHHSQTSVACAELPGQFRWAITGTPAMNALDEFYAYFRFLRAPNCSSFKLFKRNFVDGADGKDRLVAFLRPLMLRRTHNDTLLGAKLINIPAPNQDTYRIDLGSLHYDVYRIVKQRFVENINVIAKAGDLKAKYSSVLTLLLRLRQFVAHPLLIQDSIRDLLEESDFVKISDKLDQAEARPGYDDHCKHVVQHMRRMLSNRASLPELEPANPVESPRLAVQQQGTDQGEAKPKASAGNAVGGSFGLRDDFRRFIIQLRAEGKVQEAGKRITCARCNKTPTRPVVTSCQHTYCHDCQLQDSVEAAETGKANKCKRCGLQYVGTERYQFDWDRGDMPTQPQQQQQQGPQPPKTKARDVVNQWIDSNGNMLPSAKTQAFKAQVMNWKEENPDVKIVVYTQFLTMMEILAKVCEIEGWSCVKYHGGINAEARNKVVQRFQNEPITVFFATLTTGGVGLNLMMASRVIMIDPWWNQAVEQQAFCRTYRRGQDKNTSMMRFAARDTVDEHILKLQERKEREITAVMGEEQSRKYMPLSDLLRLFGEVGEDNMGNEFIYPEAEDGPRVPARWVPRDEMGDMEDGTDQ